jgi:hypothetical protein
MPQPRGKDIGKVTGLLLPYTRRRHSARAVPGSRRHCVIEEEQLSARARAQELLKNIVYEPIVLGGAVELHPLVVVIGVLGGATLFGPAGMFLAIPTITIVRVLIASSARHLKAYGLV